MNRLDIHGLALELAHIAGPSDKAPLVFLHEGLGSVSLWRQRGRDWPAELCAATGRAGWLYSRRGYGQSDPIPDVRGEPRVQGSWHIGRHEPDYLHREAWDVLPAVLEQLHIRQPVLVGHSDGASIALLYASRHPLSACVAMAPHVFVEPVAIQGILKTRESYAGALRERLARHHADPDNAFWQWCDAWLSPAFAAFNIEAECRQIRSPLLLVQGVDDEYGTLEQLRAIERAAPHARSLELPHCGHIPHRDQPAALTAALQDWLAGQP